MKPIVRQPEQGFTQSIRSQLYDILAQILADPAAMAGVARHSLLAEAVIGGAAGLGSAACRRAFFALEELPLIAADDLRIHYDSALNRPGRCPLALYESLATTGHLVGPLGLEVEAIYRCWGLETEGDLPDAASVELAFLAGQEAEAEQTDDVSRVRSLRQAQRSFLQEHALG